MEILPIRKKHTFNTRLSFSSTKYGMYEPNCGLDKVYVSWGHDEYLYQVLKHNKSTLPEEGMYMIR